MTRLKKISGLAMDKVNKMPGDTVTVYHGTAAYFIDSILSQGLTENVDNSYQSSGVNYGKGIWVTLNYDGAYGYAKESAEGFTNDNKDSNDENVLEYLNWGAILEIEIPKDMLNDEGSASNNNLKSNDIIPPHMIKQIYAIDILNNVTINYF